MATYSYSIPNTLLFLQLINISFLTSIFFFILSFFQSKKKKKSSPFLEQVKSFSQWFGINAIFHKNAIENRVLTDLAARRCSNEEFLFRYRFHEPLAKKWFGYGITRCNSRCESTIPASRRRWIVSLNHKWKRGRCTSRSDRVIQHNDDNNWILACNTSFILLRVSKNGRLHPDREASVSPWQITNCVLVKSSSLILLSRDRNVYSWDTTCVWCIAVEIYRAH